MRIDYMDSINACAAHYGEDAEAMRAFLIAGHEKAVQMENRGPIVFDERVIWHLTSSMPIESTASMSLPACSSKTS